MTAEAGETGAHVLQVAETAQAQRLATAGWLDRELSAGAKVYYKGWLEGAGTVERHWVSGAGSTPRIRRALADGQLEFADVPDVVERCGGTPEGLLELQDDEVRRALRDGFASVAMTQETAGHTLPDEAAVAEYTRQEGGFDVLTAAWPLQVLCQLTTSAESARHVVESLGVHHHDVLDSCWTARTEDGAWVLSGELDAHVARRFGGALTGALRSTTAGEQGDLHVHLAGVDFVDVACAQLVVLAARSTPDGRRLVLHDPPRLLRRLLDALGRPSSIVLLPEVRR